MGYFRRRAKLIARRSMFGVFLAGVLVAGIFVLQNHPAHAATGINKQLNYQARLLNSQGAVVPDGTYNIEFKIYQDGTGCASGGSSPCGGTLKWTETRTGSNKVTVKNGYFSVSLGSVTAFGTSVDWNQDSLWLSINVGGTGTPSWDGEMLPFRQLAASPYAMNAGQLGGLDASKFLQIAPSAVQVDTGTLSSLYLNKTGASGNILQLQKNGTDVMVLTNDGKLALGSLTPSVKLEVQSGDMAVYNSGNNARIILGDTSTSGQYGYMQWDSANDYFRIEKNGTNGVKINDNYVTIGNIYPDQPLQVANGTNLLFKVDTTGKVTSRTTTDSANAFQVQANGGAVALNVDTTNSRVGIGGVTTPATALDVTGAIQQTGMTTLNTTNTDDNKWVKLGTCTITFQYQQCLTSLKILGGQDGTSGDFPYATVNARVKQQDALGNAPIVDLTLDANAKVITSADIKTVTTQNDGTATVVSLYGRITNQYDQWAYTSVMNTGRTTTAPWVWTPSDPFQAALPAGTQTAATYSNLYGVAVQGTTSVSTASLRPITDGLAAIALQSTDATVTALVADTYNGRIAVGGSFSATEALDVKGAFQVRDAATMTKSLRVRTNGGGLDMEASGAALTLSTWSGANYGGTQYNQITFKADGSSMDFARGFNVSSGTAKVGLGGNVAPDYPLDVTGDVNTSTQYRVGGTVMCTSAGCTPAAGSANYIQNTASAQSANMYVQAASSGSVAAVLRANAAGAGAIVQLKDGSGTNVAVVGSAGATTFQNSTNSTAAFQVLAASGGGGNTVLRVDTTNERVAIGVISDPIGAKLSVATSSTVALRAYQGGASDAFQLGNATADFLTIGSTGNTLLKPTSASTTAFQIQNTSSASLFTVDTSNSNVTILGNNSSALTTWTTTTAMSIGATTTRVRGGAVTYNGYIYHLGGVDGSGTTITTTQYAKINADGTIGTWASTTVLPTALRQFQPVVANGYIYVIGGRDNSNNTVATSYYAKLNPDGTIGTWNTTTALSSGTVARFGHGTIAYNGYMYVLGGFNSAVTTLNSVYYTKINADGTLGSTWTSTSTFSSGLANINGTTVANGYAYVSGGYDGSSSYDYIRRAKLNTDGTMGSWTNQTGVIPGGGDENFQNFVANGYLYVVGGDNGSRVASFPLNADGSVGTATSLTALPQGNMGEAAGASANGYFYILGGANAVDGGGTVRNTVYYASTSRLKVGGSVDLVGITGENLAEGGTGGSLTAGNTSIVGTLQVQDTAAFLRGVTVGDTLTVGGTTTIKPGASSTGAFQVQNTSGVNQLSVDTTNTRVYVGPTAGDTTGTLLVLGNKTNSGDPTGTAGAMYYNSSTGVFRCYEGSAWADCISKHIVALGSDVANSTTSIADATGLSFSVASGRTYRFHAQIAYSSAATTTGVKWAANGPTNSLFAFVAETTNGAGAQSQCYLNAVNTLCATASGTSLTTGNTAIIDGTITTTASGTVIIRFASGVASSAITIKTGSTIEWW